MSARILTLFFGCSMRGGFPYVPQGLLRQIQDGIKTMEDRGIFLVTDHQTRAGAIQEDDLDPNIFDRENARMDNADIVVIEISNPSGAYGQAVYAQRTGGPLLMLVHTIVPPGSRSRYILDMAKNNDMIEVVEYTSVADALDKINRFCSRFQRS